MPLFNSKIATAFIGSFRRAAEGTVRVLIKNELASWQVARRERPSLRSSGFINQKSPPLDIPPAARITPVKS